MRRERDEQRAVVALYRGVRCWVGVFSETRKSRIPAGWPDLVVMAPLRGGGDVWFHEVKSATGELSPDQEVMHDRLRLRGQRVIVGGEAEARRWLETIGLVAKSA